jgi:hypothetical protein
MTPRGVVHTVTYAVSLTVHHLKPFQVTSAPLTHMSQPSQPIASQNHFTSECGGLALDNVEDG